MRSINSCIETEFSIIRYDNSILELKLKANTLIEKEQVMDHIALCKEIVGDDVHSIVIDANNIIDISNEAFHFLANCSLFNIKRVAVFTDNLGVKLIANYFKKTTRLNPYIKVFNTKVESYKWLESNPVIANLSKDSSIVTTSI